jgi:hypothetical protein
MGGTPRKERGGTCESNYCRMTQQPAVAELCGNVKHPYSSEVEAIKNSSIARHSVNANRDRLFPGKHKSSLSCI